MFVERTSGLVVAFVLAAGTPCSALFASFLVWGNTPPRQAGLLGIEPQTDDVTREAVSSWSSPSSHGKARSLSLG